MKYVHPVWNAITSLFFRYTFIENGILRGTIFRASEIISLQNFKGRT